MEISSHVDQPVAEKVHGRMAIKNLFLMCVRLFSPTGEMLSITDRNGNQIQFEYDNAGRLTNIID